MVQLWVWPAFQVIVGWFGRESTGSTVCVASMHTFRRKCEANVPFYLLSVEEPFWFSALGSSDR